MRLFNPISCRDATIFNRDIWIGLRKCNNRDTNCENGYKWADGTNEVYRGWATDGPTQTGQCVRIRGNINGFPWDTAQCGFALKFICESGNNFRLNVQLYLVYLYVLAHYVSALVFAISVTCITISDMQSCRHNPCPEGHTCRFHENNGTHYCVPCGDHDTCTNVMTQAHGLEYLVVREEIVTWIEANQSCVDKGYTLTSVISEQEANFLKQYLKP